MSTLPPSIDLQNIEPTFKAMQQHFPQVKKTTYKERIEKLDRIAQYLQDYQEELEKAIYDDFKKPRVETDLTEIFFTLENINYIKKHLRQWMKGQKVSTPLSLIGSTSHIYHEPKGVSLVIAPWNYPFNLTVVPMIYGIAAGNCLMVKPSELTPHTSAFIQKMVDSLFPRHEIAVVQGGVEVSTALLNLKFNHIYFTGSPQVGKIVMSAASKHLTSVTLELGGKSPVVVDQSANLQDLAEKLAWGKFLNAGQTCIAPDYLLIHESQKEAFTNTFKQVLEDRYNAEGKELEESKHLAHIVNERHFDRLKSSIDDALEKGGELIYGGITNRDTSYISPTVIAHVNDEMTLMQEEIFGPILPIKTYKNLEEAYEYIESKEKPLALYIFSQHRKTTQEILARTTAGGTVINDVIIHISNPNLPFGGVNNSGIGKSHGKYGYLAFTNERAVVKQRVGFTGVKLFHPPYNETSDRLLKWLKKL